MSGRTRRGTVYIKAGHKATIEVTQGRELPLESNGYGTDRGDIEGPSEDSRG